MSPYPMKRAALLDDTNSLYTPYFQRKLRVYQTRYRQNDFVKGFRLAVHIMIGSKQTCYFSCQ